MVEKETQLAGSAPRDSEEVGLVAARVWVVTVLVVEKAWVAMDWAPQDLAVAGLAEGKAKAAAVTGAWVVEKVTGGAGLPTPGSVMGVARGLGEEGKVLVAA